MKNRNQKAAQGSKSNVNKPFVETFFPITDGGALLVANIFLNF
jgi:hypothetical protein